MSITDGTFSCALCGEWLSGCGLCVAAPLVDNRVALAKAAIDAADGERELANQERAIRAGAERRARGGTRS